MKTIQTVCPRDCYSTCSLEAQIDDNGRLVKLSGSSENSITRGFICMRGPKDPERVETSLRMKKSIAILKKRPPTILLATAALFFFITSQALGNSRLRTTIPSSQNKLLVIGHRGAAGLAPENTLAAF